MTDSFYTMLLRSAIMKLDVAGISIHTLLIHCRMYHIYILYHGIHTFVGRSLDWEYKPKSESRQHAPTKMVTCHPIISIHLQSPPTGHNVIFAIIVIDPNGLVNTEYPHTVHPFQLGHHTDRPNHDVDPTKHLVIITKLTSGVAKQGRDHKQGGLLVPPRCVRVANDLFPRRHPVHLALLVVVRAALDPVQVHHGYETVRDVAYRPAPLPRHQTQYGRFECEYNEQIR
mmetsp:Transcript_21558/g.48143  ORF Transcript_21558/g.48143 Transcript_21558/m.48143 type:complete len:228 (+) Transcript_21558:77-760(+)